MELLIFAPIAGVVSIVVAFYLHWYVTRHDVGTAKMKEISDAIRIGANAYLKRQNMALAVFVAVMAIILCELSLGDSLRSWINLHFSCCILWDERGSEG
jgi:K(+)-stimulated pyrophosphate-energized sodium pump